MDRAHDAENLKGRFNRLNERQREAVDHLDGPLLVIAGPGTGKTQLLSLRAANILASRDVSSRNILCLTYSNAGVDAMRRRLVNLIGREAHGIEIATFHSFCQSLRSRYPEHFDRRASDRLISELRKAKLVNNLLCTLKPASPLFATPQGGKNPFLGDLLAFIGTFKRSGLSTESYRAILEDDLSFMDDAEDDDAFMQAFNQPMRGSAERKAELCERIASETSRVCKLFQGANEGTAVTTPGIYTPYHQWLDQLVRRTELIDGKGKTEGLRTLKALLFEGPASKRTFKDRAVCRRSLAACDLYDTYQDSLRESGLYDYDDMILDAINAIGSSETLAAELHERYGYIQVDEFQDTNGAQMRIIELLAGPNPLPNIMAVCDDDQAIMRFQGASIECIEQFQARWNPKVVVLRENYRSTPAIVELGKNVASQIDHRLAESSTAKDIHAVKPQTADPLFHERVYPSRDTELQALAIDIKHALDDGFPTRCEKPEEAIAVIACKHASLRGLMPHLIQQGVPFSYRETTNILVAESMQTLLAELRYVAYRAAGRRDAAMAQLPRIVAAPEISADASLCLEIARDAKADYQGDWERAIRASGSWELSRQLNTLQDLAAHAESLPVREALLRVAQPLSRYCERASPGKHADFHTGIRALLAFAEGECAGALKPLRPLRITDVIDRLDEAERFGIAISITREYGHDGAIQLMSAHGSKGLEFDRVYILDADDATWHKGAAATRFWPSNMLTSPDRDEDDARRLLFVSLTRAKTELLLYRAAGQTLRELEGKTAVEIKRPRIEDACTAIETSWEDTYLVGHKDYQRFLSPALAPRHLSVSALNSLVKYDPDEHSCETYQKRHLLRLPRAPKPSTSLGVIVHAYLEDYVNRVLKGSENPAEVIEAHQRNLARLDLREEEKTSLAARFDRVVSAFTPTLTSRVRGRLLTEHAINAFSDSDVPLFGICDLLDIDDDAKTVRVLDYKTGFAYPGGKPTPSYERQLQFYKLLIERSGDFSGYTVTEMVDLYVEPERGTTDELHEPIRSTVDPNDLDHLQALITAAWSRMQAGDFDTSGFEESEEKEAAKREANARNAKRLMQRAYEEWLIRTSGSR